jgi:hypothetical protein
MKRILSLTIISAIALFADAQDVIISDLKKVSAKNIVKVGNDSTTKTWKKGGIFNLNVNQGSLSNWSAGGDKFSFSLNTFLNVYAFYKKDKNSWDNSLDLAYGILNTTSLGNRKSSDRAEFTSKYGLALNKKINAAALFNIRSQFAKGYAYSKTAAGIDTASLTSKTLMPTYLLLSLGVDYKPSADFSLFLSPATIRWVIVGDDFLAPLYGIPQGKNARQEFGAFASASYQKQLKANITLKSKLDLFSNYKSNPQNVDVYWTNVLAAKITSYINFTVNADMVYDDDTKNVNPKKGPAAQFLQLMGIGFAYQFKAKKP